MVLILQQNYLYRNLSILIPNTPFLPLSALYWLSHIIFLIISLAIIVILVLFYQKLVFVWRKVFVKMLYYLFYLLYISDLANILQSDDKFLLLLRRQNLGMTQQDSIFKRHMLEKSYTLGCFWSDILRCHRRPWKDTHPIIITVRVLLNVDLTLITIACCKKWRKATEFLLYCVILFHAIIFLILQSSFLQITL